MGSKRLFKSNGFKRWLASLLAALAELLRGIPELAPFLPALDTATGAVGGIGVVHAQTAGTLDKHKIGTVVGILTVLIAAAQWVPWLAPTLPLLQKIAALLGAANLGVALKKSGG